MRRGPPSRSDPATNTSVDSHTTLEVIGLVVLVLCSALLTGAEAAFFSLGRSRLKELASQQGEAHHPLAPLLERPHELLVTLLVGITVVNIGTAALAASVASDRCHLRMSWNWNTHESRIIFRHAPCCHLTAIFFRQPAHRQRHMPISRVCVRRLSKTRAWC